MYGWIWRHLPGGLAIKVVTALLLVLAVTTLLWYGLFPMLDQSLPFYDVTVGD